MRRRPFSLTKWLLSPNLGPLWWHVHNSWADKVTFTTRDLIAGEGLEPFALGFGQKLSDLLKLHLVLDWSNESSLISAATELPRLNEANEGVPELGVDRFMDINSLDREAKLSRIEECKRCNLCPDQFESFIAVAVAQRKPVGLPLLCRHSGRRWLGPSRLCLEC